MQCPKCHFEHDDGATECPKCGIVFAKFAEHQKFVEVQQKFEKEDAEEAADLRQELTSRFLALPIALILARVSVAAAPAAVRILAMLVHESGHAVTAWLCGFWAVPGLWFTPVGEHRAAWVSIFLIGALGFGCFWAWVSGHRALAVLSTTFIGIQVVFTMLPAPTAQMLITFGGDGGSLVLGSLLMSTFYFRRGSAIYDNSLRLGFLGIGALAFMDAFYTWSGKEEDIPFGIQEGTLSDPSTLVQTYGWTIQLMMQRYVRLAAACLVALAILYVIGILRTRAEPRSYKHR